MGVLTLQWRPIRLSEVVGQGHVRPVLRAMVRSGDVPPALIFGGTRGTGKTTTARILAAALNCPSGQTAGDACGECPSCLAVQSGSSTAVLEVDAASNGGVEEVRRIREMCAYACDGDWRVVVLDEAHNMSREAFNALLKLLEEPPPGTLFVLLTTEEHKILETVRSRAMSFEFRRINGRDVVTRLREIATAEQIEASTDLLDLIARRCQGGMRDAVMALDQARRAEVTDADRFREVFGITDAAVPIFAAALAQDHGTGTRLVEAEFDGRGDGSSLAADLTLLVRDLIVLKAGGELRDLSGSEVALRQALAAKCPADRLPGVVRLLWDLKARTRATQDDQRATMCMAFVLLAEALGTRAVAAVAGTMSNPVAAPPQRLSLDQMKAVMGTFQHADTQRET